MKANRWVRLLIVLAFLLAAVPPSGAAAQDLPAATVSPEAEYVPGQIIVRFEGGAAGSTTSRAQALAGSTGGQVLRVSGNLALMGYDAAADVNALAERVSEMQGVALAEPNGIQTAAVAAVDEPEAPAPPPDEVSYPLVERKNDGSTVESELVLPMETLVDGRHIIRTSAGAMSIPYIPTGWSSADTQISYQLVWSNTAVSPTVCLLSTGVDNLHPDLAGKVVNGYDFANDDTVPNDDNGLGTHLAGIVAGKINNGSYYNGISNGKVMSVKVLGANGAGTDFDLALGLNYCANQSSVKVILVSSTGPDSSVLREAMINAILTKKKLVVTPAGDASTSIMTNAFPAAYNYTEMYLMDGVVSVAGARSTPIWVDSNGSGLQDSSESYYNCSTSTTNYGRWVDTVAPGGSINSLMPTSGPFYLMYKGYWYNSGGMTGTAQAAAFVAGAAARVWSLKTTATVHEVHDLLVDGNTLGLVVDPNDATPTNGYAGYASNRAPFCWPWDYGSFTTNEDMQSSSFLNVARAMNRGGYLVNVFDAATGLGLIGAKVQAVTTTGTVMDTAIVESTNGQVVLTNLPVGPSYRMKVSMPGYTSGYQYFHTYSVGVYKGTVNYYGNIDQVSLPRLNSNFSVVMDYRYDTDFDMMVFVPAGASKDTEPYKTFVSGGFIGYSDEIPIGSLMGYPFARWYHDGGNAYSTTKLDTSDTSHSEMIIVARRPGTSYPYYYNAGPGDKFGTYASYYSVLIRDFSGAPYSLNDDHPVVRIWSGGLMKAYWESFPMCGGSPSYMFAGYFNKVGSTVQYNKMNLCNPLGMVHPYNYIKP